MAIVGYARASPGQQDNTPQIERLTAAGASKVFSEKLLGPGGDRPELAHCLQYLREGDTLMVTKLDRLARSTSDLYRIVTEITGKEAALKVLDDDRVDTSSRTGELVMEILALIAEFETEIRREGEVEGIAGGRDDRPGRAF